MAGHIPADMFSGASFNWLTLRLLPFQCGLGDYIEVGRAGMLRYAAAMTWRLPGNIWNP
jgi:hypothetical protein